MHAMHNQAFDRLFRGIGSRHNGAFEAVFHSLVQALFPIGHGPHFTGETYLTKHHEITGKRSVAKRRQGRQQHRKVRSRFRNPHTTDHIHIDILIKHRNAGMPVQPVDVLAQVPRPAHVCCAMGAASLLAPVLCYVRCAMWCAVHLCTGPVW